MDLTTEEAFQKCIATPRATKFWHVLSQHYEGHTGLSLKLRNVENDCIEGLSEHLISKLSKLQHLGWDPCLPSPHHPHCHPHRQPHPIPDPQPFRPGLWLLRKHGRHLCPRCIPRIAPTAGAFGPGVQVHPPV